MTDNEKQAIDREISMIRLQETIVMILQRQRALNAPDRAIAKEIVYEVKKCSIRS